MTEWRSIPGWSAYEASDEGQIRSLRTYHRKAGAVLRGTVNVRHGYVLVHLTGADGSTRHVRVNRLVCAAFHGAAPTAKHEAAHWDGFRTNNVASNLRWATSVENKADIDRHGRRYQGERHHLAKLTAEQAAAIRVAVASGATRTSLALALGVTIKAISMVVDGKTWRSA